MCSFLYGILPTLSTCRCLLLSAAATPSPPTTAATYKVSHTQELPMHTHALCAFLPLEATIPSLAVLVLDCSSCSWLSSLTLIYLCIYLLNFYATYLAIQGTSCAQPCLCHSSCFSSHQSPCELPRICSFLPGFPLILLVRNWQEVTRTSYNP